ncbi:MAG: DUF5677 domain-containing protein [Chloroflexota bacterium]|nr:DUF5677 domain-containing protein [Chloroflexota bacterium]
MWKDSIRAAYVRNQRLIQGCSLAGSTSMLLLTIGSFLVVNPGVFDRAERIVLSVAISLVVAILFGWWTTRSTPKYAQTPLEFHQEQVERVIIKEWGESIDWLRETTAAAEECSEEVIQLHRAYLKGGTETTLRQTALLAMHNRLCDLSRAIADLCQRGHAEAAFMLWRSIFEIEINMQYIAQDETDTLAERFLDWGRAAHLRLYFPDSDELEALEDKYPKPDQLANEIGWTRQINPMGVPRRAKEVGYGSEKMDRMTPVLNFYEESNSYIHNDAMAITNDLGNNHPFKKGPSVSGHDMPLCLTARSIAVANDALIGSQREADKAGLQDGSEVLWERHARVLLAVATVPERLLSRFGGLDMTMEWSTEDGGTIVAIPYRRESTSEEMDQRLLMWNRANGLNSGKST